MFKVNKSKGTIGVLSLLLLVSLAPSANAGKPVSTPSLNGTLCKSFGGTWKAGKTGTCNILNNSPQNYQDFKINAGDTLFIGRFSTFQNYAIVTNYGKIQLEFNANIQIGGFENYGPSGRVINNNIFIGCIINYSGATGSNVPPCLAAPVFTLSSSSETREVNTVAIGFTINSTGGAIANFAIDATPPGMSFNTSTGALTGTPTTVAAATTYTVTATNATGSATKIFTLTVAVAAPVFTLSSSSETREVNTVAIGFTINSTGGAIANFAIDATPPGMSFNTSTGALTGTPTTVAAATDYTVTATNATGSATKIFTLTVAVAAPVFTLSSSSETREVNTVAIGFTINSTGGAIANFAIDATPPGMSFNTSTGALTGTPTTVAAATDYTVTATNATGTATQIFTLTVTVAAPAFTLSSSSETREVNTVATGFTINSTGGAIANFAINATPPGMSFNTSTGALTGTPNTVASATDYTVTATNATGTATQIFTLTVTVAACANGGPCIVGDRGPGGGIVFYSSVAGFNCGIGFTANGSPTGGLCHYLEAAPSGWFDSLGDPATSWATGNNQIRAVNGADRTRSGAGYLNSLDIVAQVGNDAGSSAAVVAREYRTPGKNDWYLPSKNEMNELYLQKVIVGGLVAFAYYWSSSEVDGDRYSAWYKFSSGAGSATADKSNYMYFRPIRSF